MLKTWVLVLSMILNLALCVSMYALLRIAGQDLEIRLTSENAHIICTYAPAIVATITGVLYRATIGAVRRTMPYQALADHSDSNAKDVRARYSIAGSYWSWPPSFMGNRPWQNILCNILTIGLIISGFLLGGKVILFHSKFAVSEGQEIAGTLIINWHVAYILAANYFFMFVLYSLILPFTIKDPTGLRWDPASLQDELALISQTGALIDLEELASTSKEADFLVDGTQRWRLGYWEKSIIDSEGQNTSKIVYGIGPLYPGLSAHQQGPDRGCHCHAKERMWLRQLSSLSAQTETILTWNGNTASGLPHFCDHRFL